ncbi:SET domain-containing protein [Ideonella livida]|uniref:SET domain-containing protein-lysine N-methyltransferase n=1 Tax=Ideonella livida TaxID=2707176 RepID=A0A7C9TI22_9BURK|nr:SET domain-containing protein-lysine N-methyltransferase [Ideonella livida]NDY90941.1 SET domain-containing protein-lysine N-methyltransferase [Ideonella livida]
MSQRPATPASDSAARRGRRTQVRRSGVHGKGVFALLPLQAGELLFMYEGEHISWEEALDRHPRDPANPDHTFYFQLEDGTVIDGEVGGNSARWINHACEPNCEAEEIDGRIYIRAMRDIPAGEELTYDYGLTLDERYTAAVKRRFACHCGSPHCQGTMLRPKRGRRTPRPAP